MDKILYYFEKIVTDVVSLFYDAPSEEKNMAVLAALALAED